MIKVIWLLSINSVLKRKAKVRESYQESAVALQVLEGVMVLKYAYEFFNTSPLVRWSLNFLFFESFALGIVSYHDLSNALEGLTLEGIEVSSQPLARK